MSQGPSRALVAASRDAAPARRGGVPALRFGTRAVVALARNPLVRRAALVGAAFVVGYRLSRMSQAGAMPRLAEGVREVYRAANGDVEAEGRLAGGWVRESITIVSSVYRLLDKGDSR